MPSDKRKKLVQSFSTLIQEFMKGKGYAPCTRNQLMERLRIQPQHDAIFHQALDHMVKAGKILKTGQLYGVEGEMDEAVPGVLRVHPRGFGFLQPDNPVEYPQDIFIPKHLTKNAVDGDIVEVLVNSEATSDKGPEGRVLNIIKRGRTHIAGTITSVQKGQQAIAYVPLLGTNQRVVVKWPEDLDLKVGDRVIMHVEEWSAEHSDTVVSVSHYIGHISDPSCDIRAAVEEFGIQDDFPLQVVQEARQFGDRVTLKEIKNREDLRHLETFTIDPTTARDFDDALSLSCDSKGRYHLAVHIADVTHYVTPGSGLDAEALKRCNSTYFPGKCIPMLPPELSNNLCSLKPNVNRLAVTILMEINRNGKLVDFRVTRSVIKSQKRFTYDEAKEVLDGKRRSKHKPTLDLMVKLCGLLKKQRFSRGSIEFSLPDYSVQVDSEGNPTGVDYIEYDITHQLVEEFMLKANEIVATHLSQSGKDITFRIHEEPAEDSLKDFAGTVGSFGFHLPETPTPQDIQNLFDEARESSYYQYLAGCYIRCMRLACYSPSNLGHYGLSLEHYCHFTSPIRRYADVIVHRVLLGDEMPFEDIQKAAGQISDQERVSARAENTVSLLKKLRLLKRWQKEDRYRQYDAVITRVKPFGVFFEISGLMVEGFLHVSALEDDFFNYDDTNQHLVGDRSNVQFSSGNSISVSLSSVDLITLETEWVLMDSGKLIVRDSKPRSGQRPGSRSRHGSKSKPGSKSRSRSRQKAKSGSRSRPEQDSQPGSKSKSGHKSKPKPGSNPEKDSKPGSKPGSRPLPRPAARHGSKPNPEQGSKAQAKEQPGQKPKKQKQRKWQKKKKKS